jgi:hypothetical protein
MKGTLISIFVGALAGVLLTVGSSVHASHVNANRAEHARIETIAPAQVAPDAAAETAVPPPTDQPPLKN